MGRMKEEKTTEQLLKEFLAKGGRIRKIPAEPFDNEQKVSSTAKTVPELKTLAEGELLYGVKKKVKTKTKKPDYSGIDMDLIPDNIKKLINYKEQTDVNQNKEESNETD